MLIKDNLKQDKFKIKIIEGKCSGGYFYVFSCSKGEDPYEISYTDKDIFCLDETFSFPYVYFFLENYFDKSIQRKEIFEDYIIEKEIFDWWDDNLFTYDSINAVLSEIDKAIYLLENDYENSELDKLKAFLIEDYYIVSVGDENGYIGVEPNWSLEEKQQFVNDNIHYLIDFYKRFIVRLEQMMRNSSDCDFICFSGP